MEWYAYNRASAFVVRGPRHEDFLRRQGYAGDVHIIPDGVDLSAFSELDGSNVRRQLGLEGAFTVGIQGHFTWYDSLGGGLGWELIQAMATRPQLGVHAILIGTGPGLERLRELADHLGIQDRIHVVGRIPYDRLGNHLAACDVLLLTLTNDIASQIRTTGKLPTYLAAGRYILASRVGGASDILPEEMLLPYYGAWDLSYPERLGIALGRALSDPFRKQKGEALKALAIGFDYRRVAEQAARVVHGLLGEAD